MIIPLSILLFIVLISSVINIRKRGFRTYVMGVLIGIDQLGNSLLGGDPDECISGRCARGYNRYWYWRWLGKILNWIKPGHIKVI
jgi:hypothetical protein